MGMTSRYVMGMTTGRYVMGMTTRRYVMGMTTRRYVMGMTTGRYVMGMTTGRYVMGMTTTSVHRARGPLSIDVIGASPCRAQDLGLYAPQGSTSLLPKLSVTSEVSAPTSCAWVGSRVHFRSSEDVILLEFTSPVDREYMRRCRKCH